MKLKRTLSFSLAALICLCCLLATDRRAYGYVDPGSGLLALQTFASLVAAFVYFLRRRIRALFGGDKAKDPKQDGPQVGQASAGVEEVAAREAA